MSAETTAPPPVSRLQRVLIGRHPKRTLVRALGLMVVTAVVFGYCLIPVRIAGVSMEPTLHDRSLNLINRLAYFRRAPRRGEIVAVRTTGQRVSHIMYCKRIIGLPGETLSIRGGTVFLDGQPLEETYVKAREPWELAPVKLGADEFFVIGDNRGMDQVQHVFGKVERRKLLGPTLW